MVATERGHPAARRRHVAGGRCASRPGRRRAPRRAAPRRSRVLFDRDGTLVVDVPYNGDPALVRAGARRAARRWTGCAPAGVPIGVVTNQSGIGRGLLTARAGRRGQRAGRGAARPVRTWRVCPHGPDDGCALPQARARAGAARPPRASASRPRDCVVIGDIGADVGRARRRAGAARGARADRHATAATAGAGARRRAGGVPRPAAPPSTTSLADAR